EVVEIRVLTERRVVHRRELLAAGAFTKPGALDPRQMPHHSQQREVRRREWSRSQLLPGQSGADVEQGSALIGQIQLENRTVRAGGGAGGGRRFRGGPGHATMVSREPA